MQLQIRKNNNILKIFPNGSVESRDAKQQLEVLQKELEQLKRILYLPLIKRIQSLSEVEINAYKEGKIKATKSEISVLENQLSSLETEIKSIDEHVDGIVSNLGNDDKEIEKAREEVQKARQRKRDILEKINQLKMNINDLNSSLETFQTMTSEQLKENLTAKLHLVVREVIVNDSNRAIMMEARPFLQSIQANPRLVGEYYDDCISYSYAGRSKIEKEGTDVSVISKDGEVAIDVDGEFFYSHKSFQSELQRLEQQLVELEIAKDLRFEQKAKMMPFKDLDFSDYDAILEAFKKLETETKTKIDSSSLKSMLEELKRLNKKIFKTQAVKADISDYEKKIKQCIHSILVDIISNIPVHGNYYFGGSSSYFESIVSFIQEFFTSFDQWITSLDASIDALKVKIEKYKVADALVKEISEERAKEQKKFRTQIKEKYGQDIGTVRMFLGHARGRKDAYFTEPIGEYLSLVDSLTEIDDGLKQQKDDFTMEELQRLKDVIDNYGKDTPEEKKGPKTI